MASAFNAPSKRIIPARKRTKTKHYNPSIEDKKHSKSNDLAFLTKLTSSVTKSVKKKNF